MIHRTENGAFDRNAKRFYNIFINYSQELKGVFLVTIEVSLLFSLIVTILFILGVLVGLLSRKDDPHFLYTDHEMKCCERKAYNQGYNDAVDEFGGKEDA